MARRPWTQGGNSARGRVLNHVPAHTVLSPAVTPAVLHNRIQVLRVPPRGRQFSHVYQPLRAGILVRSWPRHPLGLLRTRRGHTFETVHAHSVAPGSPGPVVQGMVRGRRPPLRGLISWTYQEFTSGEMQSWNPPTRSSPPPIGPPFPGPLGPGQHGKRLQRLLRLYPSRITFLPGVGYLPPPPTAGHTVASVGQRAPRLRPQGRGHVFNFPLVGAHYTNTTFGAQFLRPRVIWRYSARGRVFGPLGFQSHHTPEFWSRPRPQLQRLRRGRTFEPPAVGAHYTNTVFGVQFIRPRVYWRSSWRGRVFSPGRTFQYHPPTPWQFVRPRVQGYLAPRRGHVFERPPVGAHYGNTVFGVQFIRPRVYWRSSWRGRTFGPLGHQVQLTPLFFSRERPALLRLRRGFVTNPYLNNKFPFGPGPFAPSMVAPSRWPTRKHHRSTGRVMAPPLPYIPPVPIPVPPKPGSAGGSMSVSVSRRRWPTAVLFEHSKSQIWR